MDTVRIDNTSENVKKMLDSGGVIDQLKEIQDNMIHINMGSACYKSFSKKSVVSIEDGVMKGSLTLFNPNEREISIKITKVPNNTETVYVIPSLGDETLLMESVTLMIESLDGQQFDGTYQCQVQSYIDERIEELRKEFTSM